MLILKHFMIALKPGLSTKSVQTEAPTWLKTQGTFFLKEAECPVDREEKKVAVTFRESRKDTISGS